jgi:hypothetical protein
MPSKHEALSSNSGLTKIRNKKQDKKKVTKVYNPVLEPTWLAFSTVSISGIAKGEKVLKTCTYSVFFKIMFKAAKLFSNFFFFETGSHYVGQDGLELIM